MPFRETDSDKLLQPKLSLLFHLNFISTWIALFILHLVYIWSQVRHLCYNCFDFRNLKPRSKSFDNADASIITYSKTSEKEYKRQCIAELGDAKSEPFGFSVLKSFSQQDRLFNKKCTFSLGTCDHIFDLLLKIDYIRILDHNTESSLQGRIYCKLHDSFEHSIENCNMFHQIVQSAVDKG